MIFNITNEYIIEFQYNKNHDSGPLTFSDFSFKGIVKIHITINITSKTIYRHLNTITL